MSVSRRIRARIVFPLGCSLLAFGVGCSDDTSGSPASGAAGSSAMTAGAPAAGSPGTATGGATQTGGAASSAGTNAAGSSTSSGGSVGGQPSSSNGGTPTGGGSTTGGAPAQGGAGAGGGAAPSAGSTLVPDASWACGKPEGIVDPTRGELSFTLTLDVGTVRDLGATQYGKRRATDITGGKISGKLEGSFLSAGFDYELTLSDGSIELEQVGMLKASDGAIIFLRTCGVAAAGDTAVRVVPDFEAGTSGSAAWLNSGNFVATRKLDAAAKKLELAVYDVSKATGDAPTIKLNKPSDAPAQPWDCAKASGSKGAEVFTENVTLGSSISTGASKRGTRNVIPITGGMVSGKLMGTIVAAGADYQLASGSTTLDARYMLASSDGEFVIVRNCGPFGALIPQFETRAAGPYAFLNSGKFISSDPGTGSGGVKITFYEAK
jgi:hypothetical protein